MPKAVWHCTAVGSLHTCTDSKPPQVYLQWPKPAVSLFCTAALSRGQIAKSSVALHCCWVTAHLYQQQISIGVFAVAQACCQPLLHSSTEQGAIAKSSLALHCCWVTAHLYQQQISLGVFAVAQACCQPGLPAALSRAQAWQLPTEQCGTALLLGHCTPVLTANLHRCICSGPSLLSASFAQPH